MRKNLISVWEADAFVWGFSPTKVLNRNIFLCNSPESARYVFNTKAQAFERKSREMRRMLRPLIGDGLFISEGATMRRRRALVAPIIHASKLAQFAPVMVEAAEALCERWARVPAGAVVDVLADMGELTADIICRNLFGRALGAHHARAIVGGFARYQAATAGIDWLTVAGAPEWFPRPPNLRVGRAVRQINRVLDTIIDDLDAERDAPTCLVAQMIAASEADGQPLTREELRNEIAVLFMAGYETTANTLAWTWFVLSQDQGTRERLQTEVDASLAGRPPTLDDVARLPFVQAVIEEVLRLYPPVPHLSREAIVDEEFNGKAIPRDSTMLVVPWLLHRHEELWPQPNEFDPERFMPGGVGPVSKYAYVPFSAGPRVCPGQAFGLTEAILCVAVIAQRFELRLEAGHVVEPVCHMTLRPGERLPMTLHPRDGVVAVGAVAPASAPSRCPFGHG
ncbi:cytochrome P450 [Phenylobacterium immobile]|uniref:cytochrome P450 n=1 Tax=Phenylobacterium immobile TaxID=21 RepID=UPI000B20E2A2|nr:cytochrome P450 [Phenylobacterium immobile]